MTWLLLSSCGCCNGHTTDFSLGVFSKAHLESQRGANCPPQRPAVWAECLIGVWQGGRGTTWRKWGDRGKDGAKTGTGGLWALGLVSNYTTVSQAHKMWLWSSLLFLTRCCCHILLSRRVELFFFFCLTSHLAYLRQWFQMCDLQRAWELLAKELTKVKQRSSNYRGGWVGGAGCFQEEVWKV